MISINVPSESAEKVYLACVERTRDALLKGQLRGEASRVAARAKLYLSKAPKEELYSIPPETNGSSTEDELAQLYDRVLVNGSERPMYDRLRSLARFARCPLCAQRDVKTLDHY